MVKKAVLDQENDGVSFNQFADEIGAKPERLVEQFKAAGINITGDLITQEQKQQLLKYLQQQHGAKQDAAAADKIVLRRAKTSEIKIGGTHGTSKTVSIQVRKKRTYVKRPVVEEETPPVAEPIVEPTPEVLVDNVVELTPVQAQAEEVTTASVEPVATESENKETVTPAVAAESASGAPAVVEQKPVDPDANKTEEEKAAALKRSKEKHKTPAEEEQEAERNKKKKKTRDTTREPDRKFESLLARGADLGRVFKQVDEDSLEGGFRRGGKGKTNNHGKVKTQAFNKPTSPMKRDVEVPETITLSDLAQRMSVKAAEVIKVMMKMGVMATINQAIDQDVAILVVEELGHRAKAVSSSAVEDNLLKSLTVQGDKQPRPPVITIMGHVDHGKTTLLDYIRTTKVAASEAGGITQHIGAYHVQTQKGTITFLDTPGHAAFTAMRARGAKLTDIVILVVAADDGVMPQTVEAIQHAKAAGVPIVIAVNKMDKHGVDPDRVKTELSKNGVVAEDWGGDTMFVPISAKTGMGVDDLLDSILIQAEVLELKAVVDHPANGVVIESRLDRGRGAVMSVLVQEGTLRKGDIILAGLEYGRIRALFDENGKSIQSAGPSIPVEVLGLSGMTQAGDDFIVVPDEKRAREVAFFRQAKHRETKMARTAPSMEDFMSRMENQKSANVINVVLKADVLGSAEALKQSLLDLSGAEVRVNIVSSGIGGLNESDVNLAIASGAIIVAFNVRANVEARKLIETNKVDVHYYNIIYDAINQVKKIMSGTLAPEIHEKIVGLAQVREVFRSSKTGAIAGCMVLEGHVKRNFPIRVLRDNVVVFEGALESLRRFKEDVADVRAGMECGIAVKSYNDIKAGDQIEVFEKIEVKREI